MRRGDHLPGGEGHFSKRGHSDLNFLDGDDFVNTYEMPPPASHRADRNGSSRFAVSHSRQGDVDLRNMRNVGGIIDADDLLGPTEAPPNFDSDEEDVVLPEMRPCAGPACSKPAIRSRYCSEECHEK